MATLFGVWFTFTLVQPNGMMGMAMNSTGVSMDMSVEFIAIPIMPLG